MRRLASLMIVCCFFAMGCSSSEDSQATGPSTDSAVGTADTLSDSGSGASDTTASDETGLPDSDTTDSATTDSGSATMDSGSATMDSGSKDGGMACGTSATSSCPSGSFCETPVGMCTATGGTCKVKPTFCSKNLDQVCGCDGKTYNNPCEAQRASVSVGHTGACT